jgi:hypothetical protein
LRSVKSVTGSPSGSVPQGSEVSCAVRIMESADSDKTGTDGCNDRAALYGPYGGYGRYGGYGATADLARS